MTYLVDYVISGPKPETVRAHAVIGLGVFAAEDTVSFKKGDELPAGRTRLLYHEGKPIMLEEAHETQWGGELPCDT